MRPLAVLIGIVMGSAVSLAVGLLMTMIVILLIPEHADRLAAEKGPLVQAILLFTLLSAAAAASFYGEIRLRRWRFPAHLAMVAVLGLAFWVYWPS
ncbi:MAG TPA: hypothetical protein VFS52_17230 [Steroidobacteraceae bacterium]|jgi:multisubunit Na+/H+ antiporter MnhF subunit|nr:hypothetical protein [Steroidobacteraceae bacterium]